MAFNRRTPSNLDTHVLRRKALLLSVTTREKTQVLFCMLMSRRRGKLVRLLNGADIFSS